MCFLFSLSPGLKMATKWFVVAFSIVKLVFSKTTGWISSIKLSQDRIFSENYFGLRNLRRSLDRSITSRIIEIICGIDVCGKPLKTRFKTVFSFFFTFCKSWSKLCNRVKNIPVVAGRLVYALLCTHDKPKNDSYLSLALFTIDWHESWAQFLRWVKFLVCLEFNKLGFSGFLEQVFCTELSKYFPDNWKKIEKCTCFF